MRQTVPDSGAVPVDRSARVLTRRIARTKAEVKRVDLFSTLAAVATLGGLFLLGGIALDHFFANGLSPRGRILYFGAVAALLVVLLIRRVLPIITGRINPFYAADILEKNRPSMKNALINWLGLERERSESRTVLERAVLDGLTNEAASEVAKIPDEAVVDHTPVIRWGIALAIVVAALSLYSVLAPKNPFVSASRILFPLADIDAPQRVRFLSIMPGDATFYQGRTVPVRAEIAGGKGAPVRFVWETADRRRIDQEIPMTPVGGNLYELDFPPAGGLTESLAYRIKVGSPGRTESVSREYKIEVRPPVSFEVESLAYSYPDYTGLEPKTEEKLGAIRAVEGTSVTITGLCSERLKRALWVPDFSLNRAASMAIDPENDHRARYEFTLNSAKNSTPDAPSASAQSYRIVSFDAEGIQNLDEPENPHVGPAAWKIELLPDLPPTIEWNDETPGEVEIPLDGTFTVQVKACDPDFALRRVRLIFERRHEQGDERISLDEPIPLVELLTPILEKGPTPHTGEVVLTGTVSPKELGLAAGDKIDYYAEALDSRLPTPNSAKSPRRGFTVAAADAKTETPQPPKPNESSAEEKESGEGESGGESKGDQSGENESNDGDDSQKSQQGENQSDSGEPSETGENQNPSQGEQEGRDGSKPESAENSPKNGQPNDGNHSSDAENEQNSEPNAPQNPESDSGQESPQDSHKDAQAGENSSDGSEENAPSQDSGASQGDGSEGNEGKSDANGGGKSDPTQEKNGQGDGNPQGTDSAANNNGPNSEKGSPSNESNAADKSNTSDGAKPSENQRSESPESSDSNAENPPPEPIDPQTNPGDAFEKILNHCSKCSGGKCPLPNPEGAGDGSAQNPSQGGGNPSESQAGSGSAPENAPRQTDTESGVIPPDAPRERGEVDPATRNYMATDGQSSGEDAPSDARVATDPNHPAAGENTSPQDRQNAHESTGGSNPNGSSDGAIPADSNDPNAPSGPNAAGKSQNRPEQSGTPTAGGSNGESPAGEPESDNAPHSDSPNDGQPGQQKEGNGGASDTPSANNPLESGRQGTGGVGAGDLTTGPAAEAADAAHLAYSEAATSLALEHLRDQLEKGPDPELLRELGWTKEELSAFLRHWESMKRAADPLSSGNPDKKKYLDKLRNMGLWETPPSSQLRGEAASDDFRDRANERESSRTAPPSGFSDRFKAYNLGISRQK